MKALTAYLQTSLRFDLIAGLTVAMIAVPQAMAYAAIAGVNPIYGLYTAILPAIIAALFGSSRHLNTGPTNGIALVTIGVLLPVVTRADYVEYVFATAIISGTMRLLLGVLRLGGIIRYVSNAVLTGFLAGASILIIVNQLGNLLGLPRSTSHEPLGTLYEALRGLLYLNPFIALTGIATILLLLVLRRINQSLPAPLLTIVFASLGVQILGWDGRGLELVSSLGSLQVGLVFHIPQIDWFAEQRLEMMLVGSGAVALLGLVEPLSVAKSIAATSGQRIDSSREFVGQGLASLVGGFFQCIPSSGSLSRSAVNFESGAHTRGASILSGIFVFLVAIAFAPWLGYIPLASLAGIVMVTAIKMINRHQIEMTWRSGLPSRLTFVITLVATLFLPLHLAIYLDAFLSIAIYLYETSRVQLSYLVENGEGKFSERRLEEILQTRPPIAIINIEGALYFAAVEDLERQLDVLFTSGVKTVILRMRRVRLLDSTGVTALERIATTARKSSFTIMLCGLREDVAMTLEASGITRLFGTQNIFEADDTLFESTRMALRHAERQHNVY